MAVIGKVWAGRVYGTNIGNVAAKFSTENDVVSGTIRFNDESLGPVVYQVSGSFDGTTLRLTGIAVQKPEGVTAADVTIAATLTSEGQLRGEWSSAAGTGGNFVLHPHDVESERRDDGLPPQLHNATRKLGALRLHDRELADLVDLMAADLGGLPAVVTFRQNANEKIYYWNDFAAMFPRLGNIGYLRLHIQQNAPSGNRSVTVELDADGENAISTSGPQESWVIGKAETIFNYLRRYQAPFVTGYRRFGLNQLLVLLAVVAIPDMAFWPRVVFLGFVILLSALFSRVHTRLFPNFLASSEARQTGALGRAVAVTLSWLGGLVAAVVAGVVAYMLTEGVPETWPQFFN